MSLKEKTEFLFLDFPIFRYCLKIPRCGSGNVCQNSGSFWMSFADPWSTLSRWWLTTWNETKVIRTLGGRLAKMYRLISPYGCIIHNSKWGGSEVVWQRLLSMTWIPLLLTKPFSVFTELRCHCHCLIKDLATASLLEYVATHSHQTGYLVPLRTQHY